MSSKQKVMTLATKLGVEVISSGRGVHFEITVEAPEGYCWEEGLHEFVESIWDDQKPEDLWKDLLERMSDGVELCKEGCEYWS